MKKSKLALAVLFATGACVATANSQVGNISIHADNDDTGGERLRLEAGTGDAFIEIHSDESGEAGAVYIDASNNAYDGTSEIGVFTNQVDINARAYLLGATRVTNTFVVDVDGAGTDELSIADGSVAVSGSTATLTGSTELELNSNTLIDINSNGGDVEIAATGADGDVGVFADSTVRVTGGDTASFLSTDGDRSEAGLVVNRNGMQIDFTQVDGSGNYDSGMRNGNAASQSVVINALGGSVNSDGTGGSVNLVDNMIIGDTLVDGNMYINGTLTYSSNTLAETVVTGTDTVGEMTIVNGGQQGAVVDANGQISQGTTTEATASLTVENTRGNMHGIVVQETRTTISGGTTSSSLTLDDRGATFSDSSTGAPVQVHGVDDGTADFDAVNVRQFGGAIAATAAMAQIPELDSNATGNLGIGLASFMGYQGLAVATQVRVNERTVIRGGVSSNLEGKARPIIGVGAAFSW